MVGVSGHFSLLQPTFDYQVQAKMQHLWYVLISVQLSGWVSFTGYARLEHVCCLRLAELW